MGPAMTKDDLYELMKSDPQSVIFREFQKLPDSLKTTEVAEQWLRHHRDRFKKSGFTLNPYLQIKHYNPELITDSVRFIAVEIGNTLYDINPDETKAYKEIAVHAIMNCATNTAVLAEEFHTLEMLEAIVNRCPYRIDTLLDNQKWMIPLLTPEMKKNLVKDNLKLALSLDESEISREQWKKLLDEGVTDYVAVERSGRLHVLVEYIRDGGWPNPVLIDGQTISFPKVATPTEALDKYTRTKTYGPRHVLYKAWLHAFPIEEVLAATDNHEMVRLLMDIFPEDALRPHLKLNRALRARLLENDLGM